MPFDPAAADAFAGSFARDAAFDQLLRLAASYSSPRPASAQGGSQAAARKSPLTEDIERRAYDIYLSRGGADGNDVDDWLQAERQVLEELKKEKASLRLALAFGLLKAPLE
jgi:Protein of unknown function (DUF2934)